jgi:hypothetical protein
LTEKVFESRPYVDIDVDEGLQIGGEGMSAFYDSIVPNLAGKLGKPFGAKVEMAEVSDVGSVPSLPVTEAMKSSIRQSGVPVFQERERESERGTLSPISAEATEKLADRLTASMASMGVNMAVHVVDDSTVIDTPRGKMTVGEFIAQEREKRTGKASMFGGMGNIWGFAMGNAIYLNRDRLNANTPIHEAGHLFWRVMPQELKARIIAVAKHTKMWAEFGRPGTVYAGITSDDAKADEIFNTLLGNYGALSPEVKKIVGQDVGLLARIMRAVNDALTWIKANVFGMPEAKLKDFARRTLGELLNAGVVAAQPAAANGTVAVSDVVTDKENAVWNAELDEFENGTLRPSDVLHLGAPRGILRAAGLRGRDIVISQKTLSARLGWNVIKIADIRNLAEAIQHPILVYQWGKNHPATTIVTEIETSDGRKIAVGIRLENKGNNMEVNEIATIHGKTAERLLEDFAKATPEELVEEKLKWVEKEKVLNWLDVVPPKGTMQVNKGLNSIANIIQNFENPNILEENYEADAKTNEAIRAAEQETDTEPTEAQAKAGNYRKGHVTVRGFDISIENPKGSVRRGVDENGKAWETKLNNTYGYFGNTESKDGDHIDVFLGDYPETGRVFVVDQKNPDTGKFDEHKVMFGFNSLREAKEAYLSNYETGWNGLMNITEVDIEDFRKWAVDTEGRRVKPFAAYRAHLDGINPERNLIAVRTLSPEKVMGIAELGGLPMPSLAVLPANRKAPNNAKNNRKNFDDSESDVRFHEKFQRGINADELYDLLEENTSNTAEPYRIITALEKYFGGEIVEASSGARYALENGLIPFAGNKYAGEGEEYHHFRLANGDVVAVPFRKADTPQLSDFNTRFNEELENITPENANETVLQLGTPSASLLSAGIPNKPMYLHGNKLLAKARKHGYSPADIKNLPEAIANPIAVFEGSHEESFAILTELNIQGNKVLASIETGKGGEVDINLISSVYGKSVKGVVYWINNGKTRWVDHKKILDYLSAPALIAGATDNPDIETAASSRISAPIAGAQGKQLSDANIQQEIENAIENVKNFENPNFDDSESDVRFHEVNGIDVRNYLPENTPMQHEDIDRLNGLLNKGMSRWIELNFDRWYPVRKMLDMLRARGVDIAPENDFYLRASAAPSAVMERYNAWHKKYMTDGLAKVVAAIHKLGYSEREVENYAILKFGIEERNPNMRIRELEKYKQEHPGATPAEIANKANSIKDKDYSGVSAVLIEHILEKRGLTDRTSKRWNVEYDALEEKSLPELEKALGKTAAELVDEFEKNVEARNKTLINDFWKAKRAATDWILDTMYAAGGITEEQYNEYRKEKYYIPLRGFDRPVGEDVFNYSPDSGTFFSNPNKQARGRRSRSRTPFAYIDQMAKTTINFAVKNALYKTFYNLALQEGTLGLIQVERTWYVLNSTTGEWVPVEEDPNWTQDEKDNFKEHMQRLRKAGTAHLGKLDIGMFTTKRQGEQHRIPVWVNGEEFSVYINADPEIARSILGSNMASFKALQASVDDYKGTVARMAARLYDLIWRKGKNAMAKTYTSYSPKFIIKNMERDLLTAISNLPVKEGVAYTAKIMNNLRHSGMALARYYMGMSNSNNKYDRMLAQFLMNGGRTGYIEFFELSKYQDEWRKEVKRGRGNNLVRKMLMLVPDTVEALNLWVENLTRFSVFLTSMQENRGVYRSVSDAKEVTVNFNRTGAGRWVDAMKRLYLFANPALQALYNEMNLTKAHPWKNSLKWAFYGALPIVSVALARMMSGGDDGEDKYAQLSDYIRWTTFPIYTGNGFITVSLPQEFRPFQRIGDILYMISAGKKDVIDGIADIVLGFAELSPVNPIGGSADDLHVDKEDAAKSIFSKLVPDAVSGWWEVMPFINKNFMGSTVYNTTPEHAPEWTKAKSNRLGEVMTPKAYVWLSKFISNATGGDDEKREGAVDINPDAMNHIVSSYLGGAYTTVTDLFRGKLMNRLFFISNLKVVRLNRTGVTTKRSAFALDAFFMPL